MYRGDNVRAEIFGGYNADGVSVKYFLLLLLAAAGCYVLPPFMDEVIQKERNLKYGKSIE